MDSIPTTVTACSASQSRNARMHLDLVAEGGRAVSLHRCRRRRRCAARSWAHRGERRDLAINYLYADLARLGLNGLERFLTCYLVSQAVADAFGLDIVDELECHAAAAGPPGGV